MANTPKTRTERPVAILGGNRIPFARQDKAYAKVSNQDMFTAALDGSSVATASRVNDSAWWPVAPS